MRKAYISGKITGDDGWQEKFRAAQRALEADGWTVLSPLLLRDVALDYQDYLAIDYAMIGVCDAVAFLPDWEQSPGARAEFAVASAGRKQVIYLAGGAAGEERDGD